MPKPLIFSDNRAPEDRFDPEYLEHIDPSEVPGYSNVVRANEIASADDLLFRELHKAALRPNGKQGLTKEDIYQQLGTGPRALDFELSWQRDIGPTGITTYSAKVQMTNAERQGWRPISLDELKKLGCSMPPTATLEADGTIRRLDTVLCVRSAKVARRWSEYNTKKALEAEGKPLPDAFQDGAYDAPTFAERERETITLTH